MADDVQFFIDGNWVARVPGGGHDLTRAAFYSLGAGKWCLVKDWRDLHSASRISREDAARELPGVNLDGPTYIGPNSTALA